MGTLAQNWPNPRKRQNQSSTRSLVLEREMVLGCVREWQDGLATLKASITKSQVVLYSITTALYVSFFEYLFLSIFVNPMYKYRYISFKYAWSFMVSISLSILNQYLSLIQIMKYLYRKFALRYAP
jgi:hypothetical protein